MKALCFGLLISLCAMQSSIASQSSVYLSCDVVVQVYAPKTSSEPTNVRMDVTIEGSGKSLLIKSSGKYVGVSFYANPSSHLKHVSQEIEDRSTDAMWDVAVRFYEKDGGLFSEDRLVINRYTGSIKIEHKTPPASINAVSEGTCKRHAEKKF